LPLPVAPYRRKFALSPMSSCSTIRASAACCDALSDAGSRRRRPVVVRHPERELDEGARQLLHDPLDRHRLDAVRRRHSDLCHDSAPLRVPEAHLDDRAGADLVGNLVRELARERTRGDEGIDGREAGQDDQRRVTS
jgi:hypothetical protein